MSTIAEKDLRVKVSQLEKENAILREIVADFKNLSAEIVKLLTLKLS